MNAVKLLDAMTIGYASEADITSVTLEMSGKDAMAFLFDVSKWFQESRREGGPVRDFINLGQPFYYRGTWFRVVEAIQR